MYQQTKMRASVRGQHVICISPKVMCLYEPASSVAGWTGKTTTLSHHAWDEEHWSAVLEYAPVTLCAGV